MASLMSQVREVLVDDPTLESSELYEIFPDAAPSTIRSYKTKILRDVAPKEEMHPLEKFVKKGAYPDYERPFEWQKELYDIVHENDFIEVLVPREHGKSVLMAWLIEETLTAGENVLLLGWTDQRKTISSWVYNHFHIKEELNDVKSEFHFSLTNGAKFDCYNITSKDVLGFHDVYMYIDDPIEDSFREEPHKEAKLERRWKSTLANINPHKIVFSGTRKAEFDFFNFIEETYGDKLIKYVKTPYTEDGGLLCPEIWSHDKLKEKRKEIGEYWWASEYEQNPHPIEAGVLEEPQYVSEVGKADFEYAAICVDSARTVNENSDFTAIVTVLKRRRELEYVVISSIVKKLEFEDILNQIESVYKFVRHNYVDINIIVPIEKNGGGEYIIQSAKKRGFKFAGSIVPIHQSKDKYIRIESALEVPLREGTIKFLENPLNPSMKDSELVLEIKRFPNSAKVDAVDALAMGILELENKHSTTSGLPFMVV